jgi:enoyl-CoA hydratase/carnithine racemase
MTNNVLTERDGPVLKITLNRPDKKNALTGDMYRALVVALNIADKSDDIRAIVLTGSGGSFTAGNDIADFLAGARDKEGMPALQFIKRIATCETPVVAAVDGVAVGVGTTLIFHCDLVYASPRAMFRMPFVDLGLVPEAASSLLVPRRVGMVKATELLMLAEPFDGVEGQRIGVVNEVVETEALVAHAMERAHKLASKPAGAIAATRKLIRGDRADILACIEKESEVFGAALVSEEARNAFMAFMTKKAG